MRLGQVEAAEGDVRGRETAREGGGVVRLWRGDFLLGDLRGPEGVRDLRLLDAGRGEVRVGPDYGAVAVFLGPVALGSRDVSSRKGRDLEVNVRSMREYRSSSLRSIMLSMICFVLRGMPIHYGTPLRVSP